jgi:hypothetical protein
MKRLFLLVLMALLGACAPALMTERTYTNDAALINAPTEYQFPGLADQLEAALRAELAPDEVAFADSGRIRTLEGYRNLYGFQGINQGAMIAQTHGARYAVLASAPVFERTVKEIRYLGIPYYEITSRLQLQAIIVDARNAERVQTYLTPTYKSVRLEPRLRPLPEGENDPDIRSHLASGLEFIARPLATDLSLLATRRASE